MKRNKIMPNYWEDPNDDEFYDSDVTWSVQEAINGTVEDNLGAFQEVRQQKDPLGYRYMSEGKEKRKKNKKHHKEHRQTTKKSSQEPNKKVERVPAKEDPGYGIGLSRGFSLWRTLKDVRHCITKVSDPMTKAQRRSLRRKLTYYVDDLERIVVGVNPRASETNAEESVSGDEEMREEVNSLIEDALDEAALQGKIVQSDYFETRMSYLEQQCATLKKQLEGVTSMKLVAEEALSKKGSCNPTNDQQSHSQAGSSTSKQLPEKQDYSSLREHRDEESKKKSSCNPSQEQQPDQACSSSSKRHQKKQGYSSSTKNPLKGRAYLNVAKKRKVEESEEPILKDVELNVQEVGQKDTHLDSQSSSNLHSYLCSLQTAVIERISNGGSADSHTDVGEERECKPFSVQDEHVNSEAKKDQPKPDLSAWMALGKKETPADEEGDQVDPDAQTQDSDCSGTITEPFRGWGVTNRRRGRGRGRPKKTPAILKRISLKY